MGKEFFGKLLNNRLDKPAPWDRDDSEDGLSAVDLDTPPESQEEPDLGGGPGGDGQSSSLPEVSVPSPEAAPPPEESASFEDDSHDEAAPAAAPDPSVEPEVPAEAAVSTDLPADVSSNAEPASHEESSSDIDITPSEETSSNLEAASAVEMSSDVESISTDEAFSQDQTMPAEETSSHVDAMQAGEMHSRADTDSPEEASSAAESSAHTEAPSSAEHPELTDTGSPADATSRAHDESRSDAGDDHHRQATRFAGISDVYDQEVAPLHSHIDDEIDNFALTESDSINIEQGKDESASYDSPDAAEPAAPQAGDATSEAIPNGPTSGSADGSAHGSSHGSHARAASSAEEPVPNNDRGAEAASTSPNGPRQTPPSPSQEPPPLVPQQSASQQPPESPRRENAGRTRERGRRDPETPRSRAQTPAAIQNDAELRGIKDRVVIRLLEKQLVSPGHVKAAIAERSKGKLKATLWRIVAYQKGVDREAIYREAALTYAFVERKLDKEEIDLEFVRQVADVFPEKRRNRLIELRVVPVGYEFEQQTQMLRVVFLTHDPSLPAVRELMQELNLERYELQYAPESAVKDLLAKAYPRKNEYLERMSEDPLAYDLGMTYEDDKGDLIDEDALEAEINRSSLINLFEAALVESVLKGASDIHIYPNAKRQVEIHFRVDGRLVLWHIEDKVHPESLLAVIKDNTMNVDRFERDMAQDGFIQRKVDDTLIRYRVSILPIATAQQGIHAESIVIRVLDDRKVITDLSQLGLLQGALDRFDMAIRQPHGMVILTGPTGSGKSTTLVAALHQVVNPEINVLTVEDPVEYIIPGVRQIKLNHKLDLEQALRAILRHDPDVVMVGEMRDRPTAELAIKLANTGHLTFSTLHTNDAPSAVSRLYKMGVEPFLIAYAINLVVAQRLIRGLCMDCKVVDRDPDPILLDRLGFTKDDLASTTLYKPSGDPTCKNCKGTGYKGRRAISEALYFSRAIRHLVVEADSKIDEDALREAARKEGMLTLQDSAREVVKMGMTSIDEMMRVTSVEE